MSKRRLERELDELADDILADLDPAARLRVVLTAHAQDMEDRCTEFVEACPTAAYEQPVAAYRGRIHLALTIARFLVHQLETSRLRFEVAFYRCQADLALVDAADDDELSWTAIDFRTPSIRLAKLYLTYVTAQHVAEELLGVDLTTFGAVAHDGPAIVEAAAETLTTYGASLAGIEDDLAVDDWPTVDAAALDVDDPWPPAGPDGVGEYPYLTALAVEEAQGIAAVWDEYVPDDEADADDTA